MIRPSLPLLLVLSLLAPSCGDSGDVSTGLSAGGTTTGQAGTTGGATTGAGTTTTTTTGVTTEAGTSTGAGGSTTGSVTTSAGSSGEPETGSTTADPNCPPVKGEYNDCTDEQGEIDNKLCKWMGTGENGFITCLNAAGMMGASTCSLVNCELDCHCFNQPATGTAKSICKKMATDKGDNACVLDCSGGATCPDGMVCDNDTCFWPAP